MVNRAMAACAPIACFCVERPLQGSVERVHKYLCSSRASQGAIWHTTNPVRFSALCASSLRVYRESSSGDGEKQGRKLSKIQVLNILSSIESRLDHLKERASELNDPDMEDSLKIIAEKLDCLLSNLAVAEEHGSLEMQKSPLDWRLGSRPGLKIPVWSELAIYSAGLLSIGVSLSLWKRHHAVEIPPTVKVFPQKFACGMKSASCDQLLGHFWAEEAPETELKAVLADGSVTLRVAAANSFLRMQEAARQDAVWLAPLSGFRSVKHQQQLFFDVKAERTQSVAERAKVSAPPGYSEHHTGYALDIGDSAAPQTHIEEEFEFTAASEWLHKNAARFHFELSFPRDNSQGVMYEPWHWRFVGDDHSLKTFFQTRQQQ